MRRNVLFLVFASLFSTSLSGQVTGTSLPVIRDQDALNAVQAAITALGGATAVGTVQSWQAQGQGQGVDPNGQTVTGTVTWEMAGAEFRIASVSNLGSATLVTGHGTPAVVGSVGSKQLPSQVTTATIIPAFVAPVLLNEFQNSNCGMHYVGPKSLGQEAVTVVKTVCFKVENYIVTGQTWYFDNSTNLPVRVEFRIPSVQIARYGDYGAMTLSNYAQVSGVLYPSQIVTYQHGKETGTITLQSMNVNATIPSSDFDPPVGGGQ